ncbi:hypothetical protein GDO86_017076 [Hymenochirus boettgeri]|uniref:Trafficking kinesin-binding protein C-terminal domain-containing protein n=1 Tax=Hymenochirus boettgeri TaxID=247094 RepID=A0A8T2ILL2_9PIPI|nr:hypothetical protein GDO86_017076 [Hymenochirus boettgeri]
MLRCKTSPSALLRRPQSFNVFPLDSLAAEIEGTMRRECSMDEEICFGERKSQPKRVFNTVKVANDTRGRSSYPHPLPIPGSNRSGVVMTAVPFDSSLAVGQKINTSLLLEDTEKLKPTNHSTPAERQGDCLEVSLHRFHLRRQNNHSELTDCSATSSSMRSHLPEKLQIVKPLEGSQTLFQWQQLAQPNLGTLLDPRPGVVTKGFKPLPEDAEYHLCDLEEDEKEGDEEEGITFQVQKKDDEVPNTTKSIFLPPIAVSSTSSSALNPGKCQGCTNSTFTFTTCRILHPSDITQVTPSSMYIPFSFGSSRCSTSTVISSSAPTCRLSVSEEINKINDSTAKFSSACNLTKLLQEQGISAKLDKSLDSDKPHLLRPCSLPLPSTPPNSPSYSPYPSPLISEPQENLPENFLTVSKPAESFLQEMYDRDPNGQC